MGSFKSQLFTEPTEDPKLKACLVDDSAHITPGAQGSHVKNIQIALSQLSNVFLKIDGIYGPKTAAAVQAYKNAPQRQFLQPGQRVADNIVGKRTIKSLDDEMDIFENETSESSLVATTGLGPPSHDHSKCPSGPRVSAPGADGRAQHRGSPINPQGFGMKINIGGEGETDFVGFQDRVTKTNKYNPGGIRRPLTEDLPKKCASDICLRATPIDREVAKEINRIAEAGCRLTVASPPQFLAGTTPFLLSLGALIEDITVFDPNENIVPEPDIRVFVIAMRGDGRFLDAGLPGPVFPPFI